MIYNTFVVMLPVLTDFDNTGNGFGISCFGKDERDGGHPPLLPGHLGAAIGRTVLRLYVTCCLERQQGVPYSVVRNFGRAAEIPPVPLEITAAVQQYGQQLAGERVERRDGVTGQDHIAFALLKGHGGRKVVDALLSLRARRSAGHRGSR
ncbi:hypothetical protein [Verrucomicrobium sp. BvORR106]|uniref:hypothetical protein n=1 Tax=Verrucomicrobium sp. BvORR106 TaxID=1403819 RepID=UPI000571226C|nr:hypothetical protein [Verrucomicrobium sp. BvORR106]